MNARAVAAAVVGVGLAGVGGLVVWWRGRSDAAGADVAPEVTGVVLPVRVISKADFVAQMRRAIAAELPTLTNENGRKLLVAHGAYECGFGSGKAFRAGWNFGNITAGSSWPAEKSWLDVGGDTEHVGDVVTRIDQRWRKYAALGEAVRDYWTFLGWTRYAPARNVLQNSNGLDSDPFAANLRAGGYFTLALAKYQDGLRATLAEVSGLWK